MRKRAVTGVCIAAVGWPSAALAQQSAIHAIEILPTWAQLALLIAPTAVLFLPRLDYCSIFTSHAKPMLR